MFSEVPQIARNWWMFALLGVICVATGIAAIVWPDITLLALGIIFGIYLLIAAIIEIIDAIFGPPGGRAISAILGIVALIAGVICIRRPGESLLAIVVVLGIYLIVEGVIRFIRAFQELEDRAAMMLLGIVDAILGILILSLPKLSLVTLAILFALSLIIRGAFMVYMSFKLRATRHATEPPAAVPA